MVAHERPPDVAGDAGHDHLAASAVESVGTDHDGRATLAARFIGEYEADQDDIAAAISGHTRRLAGCPTIPPAPDTSSRLAPEVGPHHRRHPPADALRSPLGRTG